MLRSVSNGLVLAGSDAEGDPWSIRTEAGSMLAVYTLLEDHLGVRWFLARRIRRTCSKKQGSRSTCAK